MIVFRSLALGLLGACFWLLATRPMAIVVPNQPTLDARMQADVNRLSGIGLAAPIEPATIIDVAPGVTASQIPSLVQLFDGEHVTTVNDRTVTGDLDAGRVIAELDLQHRGYIDLGVTGLRGDRRVLVLLH